MSEVPLSQMLEPAEQQARRRFAAARDDYERRNFEQAIREFDEIITNQSTTSVADDALLWKARYLLEQRRDAAGAKALIDRLRKNYQGTDSIAASEILEGRIFLAGGHGPKEVTEAVMRFDSVDRVYPGDPAIPEAMYRAAEAARLSGQAPEAVRRFTQLVTRYPALDPWTPRGLVGSAQTLVATGQWKRAVEQLQRVRNRFERSPESTLALDLNTLLYRLYLNQKMQLALEGALTTPKDRFKDVIDIAVHSRTGQFSILTKTTLTTLPTPSEKVAPISSVRHVDAVAIFFDRYGSVHTAHERTLHDQAGKTMPLVAPMDGTERMQLKFSAAAMNSAGEYLLADNDRETIFRCSADGQCSGAKFDLKVRSDQLATNDLDQLVSFDKGRKQVQLFDRNGKLLQTIPERSEGHQLRDPEDIALDRFGHIYILARSAVFVFSPDAVRLLKKFELPEKPQRVEGRALAVGSNGKLYIFDDRTQSVHIYK